MDLPFSDADKWRFKKDTNGRWIWVRHAPDGEPLSASHRDYDALEDCVADARDRGFRGPYPGD